jgi:endogenous inhibitor of DNA gyrase (YacG/DUF329 family)
MNKDFQRDIQTYHDYEQQLALEGLTDCPVCHTPFKKKRKEQKYCSLRCSGISNQNWKKIDYSQRNSKDLTNTHIDLLEVSLSDIDLDRYSQKDLEGLLCRIISHLEVDRQEFSEFAFDLGQLIYS